MHIESSEVAARPLPTASAQESVGHGSNEVAAKATRRCFTLAYKRKIVSLATGLPSGEIGALLRREGLYSSHLTHWRQLIATLDAQAPEPKRGRKPDLLRPEKLKVEKLERDNARLHKRLAQAEAIIDAQKKLCALLGLPTSEALP